MSDRSTSKDRVSAHHADDFERLRTSEELYRALVDCADDGIVVLEGDTFVDCNSKALEVFGRSREDLVGKTPFQTAPESPGDSAQTIDRGRDNLVRAYAGEAVRFDWEHETTDGEQRYLNVALTRFELPDGPRLLAIVRDVSERRIADHELAERTRFEKRLADISNALVAAPFDVVEQVTEEVLRRVARDYGVDRISLWWFDLPSRVAWGNLLYGFEATSVKLIEPFSNLPWTIDYLYSGNREPLVSPHELPADAVADREYFSGRDIQTCLIVPLIIGHEVAGVAGIANTGTVRPWPERERTELRLISHTLGNAWLRYQNEQRIREREKALNRSQRVAQVGSYTVYTLDDSRVTWDNGIIRHSWEANEIFDIPQAKETQALILDRYHPEDRDKVVAAFTDIDPEVSELTIDYRILRTDGSTRYVEERAEFDRNEDGEIYRVFGTLMDVTERVQAAKVLQDALEEIRTLKDRLQAENVLLKEEVRAARGFETIIGESAKLKSALAAAEKVAPTEVTALILGETGTGKELVARSIHQLSERRDASLIAVNCAALSADLIESELFGHEKGAFTGAQTRRMGRFELADGGTLFLDEIGDLPHDVQAKLLRVLQSGEFERLGGGETLTVDVRVIAATNSDLSTMVDNGEFRADLFYRINNFPIELPPLRERIDDIPMLANHFVNKYVGELGKDITAISESMMRHLSGQSWPGNVRELEGVIQRAMIASSGPVLDYEPPRGRPDIRVVPTSPITAPAEKTIGDLNAMQRKHIHEVLERCNWVIAGEKGAAAALGIPPSSLRSRMKRLGISRPH